MEVTGQLHSTVTLFTGMKPRTHGTVEYVCPDMLRKTTKYNVKGTAIPLQAWTGPAGPRRFEFPRFQDSRHMKVVTL